MQKTENCEISKTRNKISLYISHIIHITEN